MPLRATEREEAVGMDIVQHGEEAYASGEGAILVGALSHGGGQRFRAEFLLQPCEHLLAAVGFEPLEAGAHAAEHGIGRADEPRGALG